MNLSAYGKMADVPLDASPLQLHTQGRYSQKTFELIGRLRVRWENGFWNEWVAMFGNGQIGWLAEAQGFYAMCFESTSMKEIPDPNSLIPGKEILLSRGKHSLALSYQVQDIKKATCIGSEGELPFLAPIGRQSLSVDLSNLDDAYACMEYCGKQFRLFYGEYVEFDKFQFSNLRELDGW